MAKSEGKPMCCEDLDDNDQIVEGSYKYARSNVASTPPSPVKQHQPQQQMNTGKKKSRRVDPTSPPFSESESTEHASSTKKNKEKRLSTRGKGKEVVVEKEKRPPPRTTKTNPSRSRASDEASFYGVTHQTVASSRPRAYTARPQSYYGQTAVSRPPLSQSAQWAPGPPGPLAPNQSSYPPPQWMVTHPMGTSPYGTSPMSGPGSMDYFGRTSDSLASRFVRPEHRPRSAMGMRPPSYGPDDYEAPEKSIIRRPSLSKRAPKEQEDRVRMPPPSRPQTTQPARQVFKAPPPQRKSVVFPDDELHDFEPDYPPIARHPSIDYSKALPIRSRRQSLGPEYNHEQYALEPVQPKRREKRRSASYALSNKHDDQMRNASQYQDEVNGGLTAHLTAENLRHVKNGSSSHSTRSSAASRDESSYRQSATTRTTRSGSGDDDITIKLHGGAVVEVGTTKISCIKGGEINIPRAGGGSDRGTVYDDDVKSRASRYERPMARTRSNSQSGYARALPAPPYGGYAPPHPYPTEYAPYPSGYAPYGGYHHYEDDAGGYF